MAYQDIAKKIIKDSIKTAVFIDENALEAYEPQPEVLSPEQQLSKDLSIELRKESIDLTVFKYDADKYHAQRDYVFANKDLVLLDWELDGLGGGCLSALKIVQEIETSFKNIHFCVIYTRENDIGGIITNIRCYTSGASQEWASKLREEYSLWENVPTEKEGKLLLEMANFENNSGEFKSRAADLFISNPELKKIALENPLKYAACILNKEVPTNGIECISRYDYNRGVIVLNNLMIAIARKEVIQPDNLVAKIYDVLSDRDYGFWPLLGLDLYNTIAASDTYISGEVLNISPQIFAYLKSRGYNVAEYVQSVMVQQLSVIIEKQQFALPNSIVLEDGYNPHKDEEGFVKLNAFFDSWVDKSKTRLDFGDVYYCNGAYYLCISPLCDCAQSKGEESFYFAIGSKIEREYALHQKESGYITYIAKDLIIDWHPISESLMANSSYITPKPIFVTDIKIHDGRLNIQKYNKNKHQFENVELQYLASIKQNYAQRIANFAFTHSTRVGINFAFIDENKAKNNGAEAPDV